MQKGGRLFSFMNDLKKAADLLISLHGGAVKADPDGRVSGYLVRFGSPTDTDTEGQYFTPKTDFGKAVKSDLYYRHGLDSQVGKVILGEGSLKMDDVGIWIEGQLDTREKYTQWILQLERMGRQKGMKSVLGWSSGTLPNLADFARVGDSYEITRWPLGLDASLTPAPVEPRNDAFVKGRIVSVKSFLDLSDLNLKSYPWLAPHDGAPRQNTLTMLTEEQKARLATLKAMKSRTTEEEAEYRAFLTLAGEGAPDQSGGDGAVTDPAALKAISTSLKLLEGLPKTLADLKADVDGLKAVKHPLDTSDDSDGDPDPIDAKPGSIKEAYAILGYPLGDTHEKAFGVYLRSGDEGAVKGTWRDSMGPDRQIRVNSNGIAVKASNAVDMQVGTNAEGGYLVPEGFYQGIIYRRDESSIARRAGAQTFRGSMDTFKVPADAEADGEWVITAEESDSDKDTPAIGQPTITAYEFTKESPVSNKLLNDSVVNVEEILMRHAGRGLAKTENNYFLVGDGTGEPLGAVPGGTLVTDHFAANNTISAAEIRAAKFLLPEYYEDGNPPGSWVMRRATEGVLRGLASANQFLFDSNPQGDYKGRTFQGNPIFNSDKMAAIGTDAYSVSYGNWEFYGIYEVVGMTVLRDPYSLARKRQTSFHFATRFGGTVLQAVAFRSFQHTT